MTLSKPGYQRVTCVNKANISKGQVYIATEIEMNPRRCTSASEEQAATKPRDTHRACPFLLSTCFSCRRARQIQFL